MKGEIWESALQWRKIIEYLGCMMTDRTVNMEITKALCCMQAKHGHERRQKDLGFKTVEIYSVKMCFQRGACGLNRMNDESSESVWRILYVS